MTPAEQVVDWNAKVSVGGPVYYGSTKLRRFTRAAAQVLSDGCAVVWLKDIAGAVSLDMVRPA